MSIRRTAIQKVKKAMIVIGALLLTIFVVFGLVVGLSLIIENFFAPEGWLFYEFDPRLRYSMTILLMLPVIQKVAE